MVRVLRFGAGAATAAVFLVASLSQGGAAGAIAIGTCAAYGYAYDYTELERARGDALQKCGAGACQVVATMQRNCGALAIDGGNVCGAHGYAVASRLGRAQNVALRQCYKHGGRDCVIRAWACDGKG